MHENFVASVLVKTVHPVACFLTHQHIRPLMIDVLTSFNHLLMAMRGCGRSNVSVNMDKSSRGKAHIKEDLELVSFDEQV